MAGNKVDAIFASEAIAQIIKVKQELALADAELISLSQNAAKASSSIRGISAPSGLDKTVTDTTQLNAELERQNKIIQGLETQIKSLSKVRATNNKMTAEEVVNQRILNKNALDEAKSVSNLVGAYDKLSLAHQKAFKNAQNIGAQYGSTSDKFLKASEKANKLDTELKTLDATLGKHNRNVGNYASGYNALGNSINQLTREAPAFANSINTGFMAISNNIPALTDAIRGIRAENTLLRSEGKPTQSVLMQLAGAFFSWQTAISLGVTMLTIYGGAIVGAITGSKKRKEALEKEKKAIEDKTKAEQEARDSIASVQATEISRSKVLFETANNLTLSYNKRLKAVNELKERYPSYLGHLSNEEILAGKTAKAEEDLNQALINRGKALAAQKFIQSNLEKQLSLEIEIDKLAQRELKYNMDASKNGSKIIIYTNVQKQIQQQKADIERKSNSENLFALRQRLTGLKNEQDAFLAIYNANAKYLDVVKETTKEKNKKPKTEDTTPKIKQLEYSLKSVGTIISQINEDIDRLTVDKLTSDESVLPAINFQLEQLKKLKEQLNGIPAVDVEIKNAKEAKQQLDQLTESMRNYLGSFSTDFISKSGFTETFKMLNKEIEGFGTNWQVTTVAIMESAQEMFSFINQNSEANFTAEKTRLQAQYETALVYAGDNKAAQEKLADDLEKKKADIAYREARVKQKNAIFNIGIDTAQAVISVLPNFVLAGVIAELGAAQIGFVASQEIPRFWQGGTHDGGLMMVNDGVGSNYKETIVTPSGKVIQPTGRNVIIDAPKGTEIFTHSQWNDSLNDMLNSNGISMSVTEKYKGISKEDLYDVMTNTLGSQPQYHSTFDANGATDYILRRGNKTILRNNRGNAKGYKF